MISILNVYLKQFISHNKCIWDPGPVVDPGPGGTRARGDPGPGARLAPLAPVVEFRKAVLCWPFCEFGKFLGKGRPIFTKIANVAQGQAKEIQRRPKDT